MSNTKTPYQHKPGNFEILGRITEIGDVRNPTDKLTVRDFEFEFNGDNGWVTTIACQVHNSNIEKLDAIDPSKPVRVSFSVRGNRSTKTGAVYNSIVAWQFWQQQDREPGERQERFSRPPERKETSRYQQREEKVPSRDDEDEIPF